MAANIDYTLPPYNPWHADVTYRVMVAYNGPGMTLAAATGMTLAMANCRLETLKARHGTTRRIWIEKE